MVDPTCNLSTCEAEAGGSQVRAQPELHSTILRTKRRRKERKKKEKTITSKE
jgi:hypothetical protein